MNHIALENNKHLYYGYSIINTCFIRDSLVIIRKRNYNTYHNNCEPRSVKGKLKAASRQAT